MSNTHWNRTFCLDTFLESLNGSDRKHNMFSPLKGQFTLKSNLHPSPVSACLHLHLTLYFSCPWSVVWHTPALCCHRNMNRAANVPPSVPPPFVGWFGLSTPECHLTASTYKDTLPVSFTAPFTHTHTHCPPTTTTPGCVCFSIGSLRHLIPRKEARSVMRKTNMSERKQTWCEVFCFEAPAVCTCLCLCEICQQGAFCPLQGDSGDSTSILHL